MANVIGDTTELVRKTITAKATHTVTGVAGCFNFLISEASGIKKYFESHAKVIISGPVQVLVSGPVSASIATTAAVAIIPDKYTDYPTAESEVVELQGSVRVQHSLLVPPTTLPIQFGNETAEQLKPKTLIDYPPRVVGHFTIAGGSASSKAIVVLSVPLTVEGVAHHKTW